MGVGASGGPARESHMSGKVPQSPLCGTHHTSTWIMDIWDHMDMDQINATDMTRKLPELGYTGYSIDRKISPHVRESPTISDLRHSSYLHLDNGINGYMGPRGYGPN